MKKFFVKALAVLLVCMFVLSGINFSIFASNGSGNLGDKLAAVNVAVSGQIQMMFYFTNTNNVLYYEVKVGEGELEEVRKVYTYNMPADDKGRSVLNVPLAAAQQNSLITITPYDKNGVSGKVRTYKVTDYVDQLIEYNKTNVNYQTEKVNKLIKALKSMLNYGAMAQLAFDYNTGNLANNGLFFGNTNPVHNLAAKNIRNAKKVDYKATNEAKLDIYESVVYLEDVVNIKFYFEYDGDVNDLHVAVEGFDDKFYTEVVKDEGGEDKTLYYVMVNNIPATKFDYQYTVAIDDGTDSAILKYSVLNFVQGKINQNDDAEESDAVRAMYQFYVWLSDYAEKSDAVVSQTECSHERSYVEDGTYKEICSDCGKDISPSNLLENAANLSNKVNAYYGTIANDGSPVVDGARDNFVVENEHLKFHYVLDHNEQQLVKITNKDGEVYVQNTMDVYVKTNNGTFVASNSVMDAKANIYRYGYYYYDAHMYGQNFVDENKADVVPTTNTLAFANRFVRSSGALIAATDVTATTAQGQAAYNGGPLQFTISSSNDPQIRTNVGTTRLDDLNGVTMTPNAIIIKMTTPSTSQVSVYYSTASKQGYSEEHRVDFETMPNGQSQEYVVFFNEDVTNIYGLRLDFNGPIGETITIDYIKFAEYDMGDAPWLFLDRGLHTYADKMHQVLSLVAPNEDVNDIQEIGMTTKVVASDVYIKTTDGSVIESMTSGQTVNNVAYAGFMTSAGVFGYILPAEVNNGVTYTNGSIKVEFDGTTYTITQVINDVSTIKQQPTLKYTLDDNGDQVPVLNNFREDSANKDKYGSDAIDSIGSSLNIYNSPTAFYFGQRIYTDGNSDFEAFISEAEIERNPLGEDNIEIDLDKTPGATFDGYDPIRGIYAFSVPGYVSFGDGYKYAENFHGAVSFKVKGDDKDRNIYVMTHNTGCTVEGGAVLDKNDQMLPIPTEVSKNFSHEFEVPLYLWGDVGYSELRVPVQVKAGEVQELTLLQLYMNWGKQPLKQLSSIQFFAPYYHLSTGVTETNCIANYYVHGKDLDTLPDHRAMSGTSWLEKQGDPQHDNAGYHQWLKYTPAGGSMVTSETVKSEITSSGPTYADIDMTYISDDGKIKVTYSHMEMPQLDESRTYYTIKYEILEDVIIDNFSTDFSFYTVYGYGKGYESFGYWGDGVAVNGVDTDTPAQYILGKDSPYFDMYQIDNKKANGEENIQNANVSFLIKDWSTNNATLDGQRFVVNVANREASLSINAGEVTLNAGDTITINAIVMPWGTHESADDSLVQAVRLNSLVNPIVATNPENATVNEDEVFLPTITTENGYDATFTIGNKNGYANNHEKGINVTFRVDGFRIHGTPRLYEIVDGEPNLLDISSASTPDESGNAHEYDGYAVHYNADGTYSYSFVINLAQGQSARTFQVVVDDTYTEWEENHGSLFYGPEVIFTNATVGSQHIDLSSTKLSNDGSFVTIAANGEDPATAQFKMFKGAAARYLVFKYRHENGVTPDAIQFFISTIHTSADQSASVIIEHTIVEADGGWHVMVIDLAAIAAEKNVTALVPNNAGSYNISSFRFDPFTNRTEIDGKKVAKTYDVGYIAFCSDLERAVELNGGDVSNMSYVSGVSKSSPLSEKLEADSSEYSDMNAIFSGSVLCSSINNRGKVDNYTAELVDGNVVFTKHNNTPSGNTYEAYFTLALGNETNKNNTGKYLVVKYRTKAAALTMMAVYSSTSKDDADGQGDWYAGVQVHNDGEWHVLVQDLSKISTVVPTADGKYEVNYVRLDAGTKLADGETIEYAYIGLCDELSDLACLEEKTVDIESAFNVDWVYADGDTSNTNKNATSVTGTLIEVYGWTAVGESDAERFSYVVTDPYGIETVIDLPFTDVGYSGANSYWVGSTGVQDAVARLGEGTVGYQLQFLANLYKWHGKTVTLSVRETIADGVSVEVYSVKVTVPNSDVPGYISGSELAGTLQNSDKYTATVNGSGTITVSNGSESGADGTFDIKSHTAGITPRYAVLKYKTTNAPEIYIYISSANRAIGGNARYNLNADGKWHALVIDLTKSENYVLGEQITFMRVDIAEGYNQSVEIEYIYLCSTFEEIAGELVEVPYSNNVDYIYTDGNKDVNHKGQSTITATTVDYTGWLGVNGFTSNGISYIVTDAEGNETEFKLTNSTTATNRYYEDSHITEHLLGQSYGEGTKGYQVRFNANLAAWAGEMVTITIRNTFGGGAVINTFSLKVNVPAEEEPEDPLLSYPGYISGTELAGATIQNMNYKVNADGSITFTTHTARGDNHIRFEKFVNDIAAPRYAVIKYKTTTTTNMVMLGNTTGDPGPYTGIGTTVADGQWHYAIVDLTTMSGGAYTTGGTISFMRVNCCPEVGDSLTIDYILLCDDPYGELDMVYLNVDNLICDDVECKGSATVTGSKITYYNWAAVNGHSAVEMYYVVTDANGVETIVSYSGSLSYQAATDVVIGKGYLSDTVAFNSSVVADLTRWAGQTVTFATYVVLDDGKQIETSSYTVKVPRSADPNYVTGSEIIAGLNTSGFSSTLNSDGSVTINCIAATDGTITFNSIMSGTPKYAVIRYKNTNTPQLTIYATTAGKNHKENYVTLQKDNAWHTVVVDLEAVGSYTAGDAINLLRFDFLDSGDGSYVGKSLTLDYVWFTDDISGVEYEAYDKFNVSYVGQGIVDMVTSDGWDHGIANAVVNPDGTVTITTDNSGDSYFGHVYNGSVATGNYLVLKYRSGKGANVRGGKFNALAASKGNSWSTGGHVAMGYAVADHNWHVLVINYADLASVTAIDGVYYMVDWRVDLINQFVPGSSIDFAYIGFCDDLGDIILEEGEYLEYAWQSYYMSPDNIQIDGTKVTTDGSEYKPMKDSCGASDRSFTYTGTEWNWASGWFAIDNQPTTDLSICVTDENGVEHWTTVSFSPAAHANHTWYEAADITTHNINNNGFGANTVGYRVTNVGVSLSEYAGQTVTVSLRAITEAGNAVVIYSAFVTVPAN